MPNLGRKQYYYNAGLTVATGAVDQEVDILAALLAAGRDSVVGAATYLLVKTDVQVTMKINATTATEITIDTTDGLEVHGGVMSISKIFFSHTGTSSASGNATVEIYAA